MFHLHQQDSRQSQEDLIQKSITKINDRLQEKSEPQSDIDNKINWINHVFESMIKFSNDADLEIAAPESISLSKEVQAYTIQTAIRILTIQSDLRDNALYFLNDTGTALGIQPGALRNLLDDVFDKMRYEFTVQLKSDLDQEQIYWCALILMKIICADGQIHPAEKLYFDLISELVKDGDIDLETLKKDALQPNEIPKLNLNQGIAQLMLKYVVTIAMCDGEYVGQESEFITKAAQSLGFEPDQIDSILQPIAASFMVLESLFPRDKQQEQGV
jgi:uncharacterized tellurite resistance protein B-like protein